MAARPRGRRIRQVQDALDLARDLVREAEDVRVVLREAAHAEEPVERAGALVPVDGAELRPPVDSYLRLEGQSLAEELQEDPLRPLDVIDVGRRELARPVVREA